MTEEQPTIYDDAFTVIKQRWGTYISRDLEGNTLVTSYTEEACIAATRWYLKGRQDGFPQIEIKYDGTVGGKL